MESEMNFFDGNYLFFLRNRSKNDEGLFLGEHTLYPEWLIYFFLLKNTLFGQILDNFGKTCYLVIFVLNL